MVLHRVRPWNAIRWSYTQLVIPHFQTNPGPRTKLSSLPHLHWIPLTKSSRTKSDQVGPSIGLYNSYSTNRKIWGEPSAWGCCFGRLVCAIVTAAPVESLAIQRCGWQPLVARSMIKHLRRILLLSVHRAKQRKGNQSLTTASGRTCSANPLLHSKHPTEHQNSCKKQMEWSMVHPSIPLHSHYIGTQ